MLDAVQIKPIRDSLKLNQAQLAHLLGVHPITVSKWERGEAAPTPYQEAMLRHFQNAAKDKEVRDTVVSVLIGVGVGVALALLLRHLLKK